RLPKVEMVAVLHRPEGESKARAPRRDDLRTHRPGQFAAPRNEVRMQVRLERGSDPDTEPIRQPQVAVDVAAGIDHGGLSPADVEEVGGVGERLVGDGVNVSPGHAIPLPVDSCRAGETGVPPFRETVLQTGGAEALLP